MKLKAMGIDETILRQCIDIEEKGEESSGLPTCRGQAEKEELSAKKKIKMEWPESQKPGGEKILFQEGGNG